MCSPQPSDPEKQTWELWERINTRVVHEDELIFKRLGPLLAYHGFIFAAFFLLQRTILTDASLIEAVCVNTLLTVIFGLGICMCMLTLQRINLANSAHRVLRRIWRQQRQRVDAGMPPQELYQPAPFFDPKDHSDNMSGDGLKEGIRGLMVNEVAIPIVIACVNATCVMLCFVVIVLVSIREHKPTPLVTTLTAEQYLKYLVSEAVDAKLTQPTTDKTVAGPAKTGSASPKLPAENHAPTN